MQDQTVALSVVYIITVAPHRDRFSALSRLCSAYKRNSDAIFRSMHYASFVCQSDKTAVEVNRLRQFQ